MKPVFIVAAAVLSASAFAWSDSGHGAIARIAYRHLTPSAKAKFDQLIKHGVDAKYQNGPMAAVWADDVRPDRPETGPWHYINIHFRTDGKKVTMKHLDENVAWAVTKFQAALASARSTKDQQADALRWLLHFVGDAHQPMHNVARDTDKFPEGDRGGNDFPIVPGNGLPSWNTNLHRVWDSGCGAFELPMRGGQPGFEAACEALAQRIEAAYPKSQFGNELKDLNPDNWVKDGFEIAKSFAYTAPEGGTPSADYVKKGQEICMRRAALAGYRLAEMLNKAL